MNIIKTLTGYSGSEVLLIRDNDQLLVRKINNINRNLERLDVLKNLDINLPKILTIATDYYDMPYIPHQDMVTWLLHNPIDHFVEWLSTTIEKLKCNSNDCDWTSVYINKLSNAALIPFWQDMNFTHDQLLQKLPKILPNSHYHGDLTMENCIFGNDGKFYLIDPITTDYAGWVFDLAKLQQDLVSGWFIRNYNVKLQGKLWDINSAIMDKYPAANNPMLLILMLLRVLPYAQNIEDKQFLIKEINHIWIS